MRTATITTPPIFDFARLTIRPLAADDSNAYRTLRKRILEIGDGRYFDSSYVRERSFVTEKDWRNWCTEQQDHCTIGTFIDGELIGVMGIVQFGHPDDRIVEWEATWLDPQYRKFGIARLSYEKVQQWTKEHGYRQAVVFIREDNVRSHQIRRAQGAIYLHTLHNQIWADGSIGNMDFFVIDLSPAGTEQDNPYKRALQYLNETHASLSEESNEDAEQKLNAQKIG